MITKFFVWFYKLLHRPVLIITSCPEGMAVYGSVDNKSFGYALEALLGAMKASAIEGKESVLGWGIVDLVKSVYELSESGEE